MAKTGTVLFNDLTLFDNVNEVMANLLNREELNPRHPAFPTKPRYEVLSFTTPECERGGGYFVVSPQGSDSGRWIGVCTRELRFYCRIDVLQDTQDQRGFSDYLRTLSRIEATFRGGVDWQFTGDSISTTLPGGVATVAAPFTLRNLGIYKTTLESRTAPKQIQQTHCAPYLASMLVSLTLHFYAG